MERGLIKIVSKEVKEMQQEKDSRTENSVLKMGENVPQESDIEKLKDICKDLAKVYKNQVSDDITDNGNLTSLNNAILNTKSAIHSLESHEIKG